MPVARRAYDASRRRAAAEERARRVLEVAAERFAADGWQATTVAQVAAEAGVSDDLVHQRFGSKAELLLAAVRHRAFAGAADLRDAVESLALTEEPDPARRVDLLVSLATRSMPALAPLVPALQQAATADAVARGTVAAMQAQRRRTTATAVEALLGGPPHPRVVDEVVVLTSAETYLQLVPGLGWSPEEYAAWLASALRAALERRWASPAG